MSLFESDRLIDVPRSLEIISNMTDEERKKLKAMSIKYILFVVLGYTIFTALFILMMQSLEVSKMIKWLLSAGYLLFGFLFSKVFNYLIIKKQKEYLESTQYAKMMRIELE